MEGIFCFMRVIIFGVSINKHWNGIWFDLDGDSPIISTGERFRDHIEGPNRAEGFRGQFYREEWLVRSFLRVHFEV